jgi:signal transduction histidine kinase
VNVDKPCDPVTLEVLQANVQLLAENERLEVERQRLIDLDQMKTEFLARVSHDLRTPLNSIIGFSDLMSSDVGGRLNKKHAEFVAAINRNGHVLLALINELLDLSSIESGHLQLRKEWVVLQTIADDLRAATEPVLSSSQIEAKWPDAARLAGKTAWLDRRRILQVLTNLVDNARKFSRPGDRVEITMDSTPERAAFSVGDTGPGIAPEERERIFRPYYQRPSGSMQAGSGVGLGLAIVKGIVDRHGGRIDLESDIGKGCRFTVIIPNQDCPPGAGPAPGPGSASSPFHAPSPARLGPTTGSEA